MLIELDQITITNLNIYYLKKNQKYFHDLKKNPGNEK